MIKGWTWKKDGTLGSFCDRIEGDKLYRGDTYYSLAALKRDGYEIVPMMAVEIPEPWENKHQGRTLKMCATACPLINSNPRCPLMDLEFMACGADCPAGKGE